MSRRKSFRAVVLTDADVQWVQARVRQRVLRWFVRQGYLNKDDAQEMAQWHNGGGFSVDASVRGRYKVSNKINRSAGTSR